MSTDHREQLRRIRTFPQLVRYLRDELEWPIKSDSFEDVDDEFFFEFDAEELGIDARTAAKIKQIKQLRPLESNQPWGVFFVMFEPKRLPVVALRRILGQLVFKRRASANRAERPAWNMHDLLFISSYGEGDDRQISLAHFSEDSQMGNLATLKVLGWDGEDTGLHLDHVQHELRQKLRWPEDPSDATAWRETWSSAFTLRHREVITTSRDLAIALADLARKIRLKINAALEVETERGKLRKLMKAFQEALIHDLGDDDFADMYAQTIAYGLLSARVSRQSGALVADDVALMVPVTNPFLRELMETFLKVGGRKRKSNGEALDFDELGINDVVEMLRAAKMEDVLRDFDKLNPQEDPVIHFYEGFAREYDPVEKVKRGEFYTPRPVVSYIVRSVDELLRAEFGLEDGLADTTTWGEMGRRYKDLKIPDGISPDQAFVQILDPATGTGTFLVEVIDVIHRTMVAKWKKLGHTEMFDIPELWNDYVPKHLLPRLHAYELKMAPYAIAHMKIGLKLAETGYRFGSDERARIYLTNSLEPPAEQLTIADWFPALGHEAEAVNAVKRHKRFTVVIGNPPYSIFSANLTLTARALVDQYRYIDGTRVKERGALKAEVILQDDYVKFVALAQNTVRTAGVGLIGFITNSNCYLNPVLRGLRYSLLKTFSQVFGLDLGGQRKAGIEEDVNVFDIETGVAVSVLVRTLRARQIRRFGMLLGPRAMKYARLSETSCTSECTEEANPAPEQYLFKAFASEHTSEYQTYFPVDKMFRVTSIGIKTARDHLVLDFDRAVLEERMNCLHDPAIANAKLRQRFHISDNTQWCFDEARKKFQRTYSRANFSPVEARPFDRRWLYFHPSVVFNTRPTVNKHVHEKENLCLLATRRIRTESYAHFFVTNRIAMGEILSSADNCSFFPLYLYHGDRLVSKSSRSTNFTRQFLDHLTKRLKVEMTSRPSRNVTPEHIFHYVYAVFHSPGYRGRYAEFLKIDFPRLPLTANLELFRALARLGGQLVALHLMESPKLDRHVTTYVGPAKPEVEKVSYACETVWLDRVQTRGFRGVPEEVWDFHIGGYQVCEKWLKDRQGKGGKNPRPGRVLTDEDIDHYQKIVVALSETIRVMAEIDEVIDQHGGWPDAFITEPVPTEGQGPSAPFA